MRRTLLLVALTALVSCSKGVKEENEADEANEAKEVQTPITPGQPVQITEEKTGLFAKAAVQPEAARATALATVPGGTVTKGELEEEDGKLIYSFDITVAGKPGITEVHVDAATGAVVKTEHEDGGTERSAEKKG